MGSAFMAYRAINLKKKLAQFSDQWAPKIVAQRPTVSRCSWSSSITWKGIWH